MGNFFENARKPEGFGGKMMLKMMNAGHAKKAAWGRAHLRAKDVRRVLDIGCGGGANLAELLKMYPEATADGIDYSPLSVEHSLRHNRAAVEAGRLKVVEGNVLALPYEDGAFDVVTAIETVYFWPDIENAFREVLRVLKPGGVFGICNESGGNDKDLEKWTKIVSGMTVYKGDQLAALLKNAGFGEIHVDADSKRGWVWVSAVKHPL